HGEHLVPVVECLVCLSLSGEASRRVWAGDAWLRRYPSEPTSLFIIGVTRSGPSRPILRRRAASAEATINARWRKQRPMHAGRGQTRLAWSPVFAIITANERGPFSSIGRAADS